MTCWPQFDLAIITASHHHPSFLLKFDVANELVMRKYCVDSPSFPKVPNLHCVIIRACGHLISIRQEANWYHLLNVRWKLQNILATPQVPDQTCSMQVSRAAQATITLEIHGKHRCWVSLLDQQFFLFLDVPQSPSAIRAARGKVQAHRMERYTIDIAFMGG